MSKQAPPPSRVKKETMTLAKEMLGLMEALPESEEKEMLLKHKQVAVWKYYRDECNVRLYTHRPTQDEKVAGLTIAPCGKTIPLRMKAKMCPFCKCSAQEFKRHQKTAKCLRNRAKNQEFCKLIHTFDKGKLKGIDCDHYVVADAAPRLPHEFRGGEWVIKKPPIIKEQKKKKKNIFEKIRRKRLKIIPAPPPPPWDTEEEELRAEKQTRRRDKEAEEAEEAAAEQSWREELIAEQREEAAEEQSAQ